MIKVKVSKNVIKPKGIRQYIGKIIAGVVGTIIGLLTFFLLKDYVNINILMWLIFIELIVVIGCGFVSIDGMNFFKFIFKCLKGVDKRPYSSNKGVYDDEFDIF